MPESWDVPAGAVVARADVSRGGGVCAAAADAHDAIAIADARIQWRVIA